MRFNTTRCLCVAFVLTVAPLVRPAPAASADTALPGTTPMSMPADLYQQQLKQMDDLFLKLIAQSESVRAKKWSRDFSSPDRYAASVEPNRKTVATLIGAGESKPPQRPAVTRTLGQGAGYTIREVEFPLYDDVQLDGVLLLPDGNGPFPVVIACHGDAESPEYVCGQAPSAASRFAQMLAGNGIAVLAPRLLPRATDHPDSQLYRGQDLRHLIFRMSYVLGRHPIGVDVDTVAASIDALPSLGLPLDDSRVGVIGVGQGGLTSMYAAALNPRIKAAAIIDYVDDRSHSYNEPADRAIWRHLVEFDDSDVCSLIAPRPLAIISHKAKGAVPQGVQHQTQAVEHVYKSLLADKAASNLLLAAHDQTDGSRLSAAVQACDFLSRKLRGHGLDTTGFPVVAVRPAVDTTVRRDALYNGLKSHFHKLIEGSQDARAKHWANDCKTPEEWVKFSEKMRAAYLDMMGRCSALPRVPLNPRSQLEYDTEDYRGYKVVLDVFDGIQACGVLLVPKGMKPGERRPAVIGQHGYAGSPEITIGPGENDQYYNHFTANLAKRGYVVFAPYIVVPTEDSEWDLDQKSKIVGESRTSVCIHKYNAIVDFLQTLDFVQPDHIGYQGLSYGGYTAMWVVSQEPRISPVICAGYFSDWKARLFDDPRGYMPIRSENMYTWNLLNLFNHSDLAAMICPRPFFVEHGIDHGPNWVMWTSNEYKFVQALYRQLGIFDRQRLYMFPGGHQTGTEEAFRFLDRWLEFTPKRAPTGLTYDVMKKK